MKKENVKTENLYLLLIGILVTLAVLTEGVIAVTNAITKTVPTTYVGNKNSGVLEHWHPMQLTINWNNSGEINDITLKSLKLQTTNGFNSSQPYTATEIINKNEAENLLYHTGLGNALASVLDNMIALKFSNDFGGGSYTNFIPKLTYNILTNKIYNITSNDVECITNSVKNDILTNYYYKY